MPDFVPIDDYVTDEWYPGFAPSGVHSPWATEPFLGTVLSAAFGGRRGTA